MKLRLPRRRIWRVAIYLGALLLVLIALDMLLVQSRRTIHRDYDTTRIIAPLQADGSIDYLTAIEDYFGRGVTRENNAAPMILQALGRVALANNQPADGITDRLGMPPLPEKGKYYVSCETFRKQHNAVEDSEAIDFSTPLKLPLKINDVTAQWIKENEKPLTLIADATKRPRFFIPFNGGYRTETLGEILLPYLQQMRDVASALRLRAVLRLEKNDIAGFRQDTRTMHLMARLVGQQPTMIDRLVALAIENQACEVERAGAASGNISAAEARAMAGELAAIGDAPSLVDAVNISERYMVLDTLQVMTKEGPVRTGELITMVSGGTQWRFGPPQMFLLMPLRFEELTRAVNAYIDGALAAMRQPTYPQRAAALSLWIQYAQPTKVEELSTWDLLSKKWPGRLFVPSLLSAQNKEDSTRMQSRLTQAALGLAAFKADHKAYPAALAELAPSCLATVPNDIFSEKPMMYLRTGNGYTLYSVGPNMIDDGGKSDDLVAGIP